MSVNNLILIGRNGETLSASATSDERKKMFPPLGIVDVVRLRWDDSGHPIEVPLEVNRKKMSWEVLPDRSGLCLTNKATNADSKVIILNANGTVRFELDNPWPRSDRYSPADEFGFSYPSVERGRIGVVVWVWGKSDASKGVIVEHFYALDDRTGTFGAHHPVR